MWGVRSGQRIGVRGRWPPRGFSLFAIESGPLTFAVVSSSEDRRDRATVAAVAVAAGVGLSAVLNGGLPSFGGSASERASTFASTDPDADASLPLRAMLTVDEHERVGAVASTSEPTLLPNPREEIVLAVAAPTAVALSPLPTPAAPGAAPAADEVDEAAAPEPVPNAAPSPEPAADNASHDETAAEGTPDGGAPEEEPPAEEPSDDDVDESALPIPVPELPSVPVPGEPLL